MNLESDIRDYQRESEYVKDFRSIGSRDDSDTQDNRDHRRNFREFTAYREDRQLSRAKPDFRREFYREDDHRNPSFYHNESRAHARESREMQRDFESEYHKFERYNFSNENNSRELARELLDFHREARKRELVRMQMESLRSNRDMLQDFNEKSRHVNLNSNDIRQEICSLNEVRDFQDIYSREYSHFASPPPEVNARAPPTAAPISVIRNAGKHVLQNGSTSSLSNNADLSHGTLLATSRTGDGQETTNRREESNVVKMSQSLSSSLATTKQEVLPPKERLKKDLRRELSCVSNNLWNNVSSQKETSLDTVSSPSLGSSLSAKEEDTESEVGDTPTPPRSPIMLKLKLEPNGNASLKRRQSSSSTDSGTEDIKEGVLSTFLLLVE